MNLEEAMSARRWAERNEREAERRKNRASSLIAAGITTVSTALPVGLAAAGRVYPGWLWATFAFACLSVLIQLVKSVRE